MIADAAAVDAVSLVERIIIYIDVAFLVLSLQLNLFIQMNIENDKHRGFVVVVAVAVVNRISSASKHKQPI